jgi:hypothetical protein
VAKEPPQTVGDLRRKAVITDKEISAAIEAFLANPAGAPFKFTSGHTLNVRAAVNEHRPAKAALSGRIISDTFRRTMVRTAVILATPDGGQ